MEEYKELIFEIICDNEDIIKRSINIYNQTYSTDFELVEYIFDEVNFARIKGSISL